MAASRKVNKMLSWCWQTHAMRLEGIRYVRYGFLLVFYSNFVPLFFSYSTCNYSVILKPGLGSLRVIGGDMYRSATYDFLLTFHRNHGPSSYRFRNKRRNPLKIAKIFPALCILCTHWVVPSELCTDARCQKTRMMGLPDGQVLR